MKVIVSACLAGYKVLDMEKKYEDRKQSDPNKRFHQGRSSSYAQMAYG